VQAIRTNTWLKEVRRNLKIYGAPMSRASRSVKRDFAEALFAANKESGGLGWFSEKLLNAEYVWRFWRKVPLSTSSPLRLIWRNPMIGLVTAFEDDLVVTAEGVVKHIYRHVGQWERSLLAVLHAPDCQHLLLQFDVYPTQISHVAQPQPRAK
jgi:hypothetical protein